MSKVQAFYHVVFCTKNREKTVPTSVKEDLYRFIWKEIVSMNCKLLRIGGVENHVHILLELHPTVALSVLMKQIKSKTSGWMRVDNRFPDFSGWSSGYFAATIDNGSKANVIQYIKSQPEHHSSTTLDDEFRRLYSYAGLSYDERDF